MEGALDQEYCSKAVVIQDHRAADESQLDLRVGEYVYVLEKDDSGWWGGHKDTEDNKTGWFPYNVVRVIYPQGPLAAPWHPEAVVQQNVASTTSAPVHDTEPYHESASGLAMHKEPSPKSKLSLDVQDAHNPRIESIASPTRKAQRPQGQRHLVEVADNDNFTVWRAEQAKHPDQNSSTSREVMQLKDMLKNERSKHMEELTVERGRRESLEANRSKTSAQIAQLQQERETLQRQNLILDKDNKEIRARLHQVEAVQHNVGNEAEQIRRLQEQISMLSRQEEKIWHAVEKNVSPAVLMKIKADAPPELVSHANPGGPTVEVARRLFNVGPESSPAAWTRADQAHMNDLWAKPPTVPRSAPNITLQQSRTAVSSREGTPAKLVRPFSCTDLEPDEAPSKGAVANIVRKLERSGSTPPRRMQEQGNASSRGRTPANSPKAPAWGPLQLDSCDNDEPVNFGMSPISTARAQGKMAEEAISNSKSHDAGMVRSATPTAACSSASSLVRNRVRQLEAAM